MLARPRRPASLLVPALVLVVAACGSESLTPSDSGSQCQFTRERQSVVKCFPQSLEPVTDPSSADFGRVDCSVIEIGRGNSDFCSCTQPGYALPTDEQARSAAELLEANGECESSCCDGVCFCVLLQLAGDELLACQAGDNERETVERPGWCYVEPDAGIGDPSTVDGCPASTRQLLLFTPVRSTHYDVVECASAP